VGTCNPDNIPIETVTTPSGEVPAPDIGVLWTGGPSCEANIQVNDAYLGGNIHSNGTIKFQPGGPFSGSCDTPPAGSPIPNGGWVFGDITYADDSLGNWPDAKIHECDWSQMPDAEVDPVVCGASCATSASDLTNDNDPKQVIAYVDGSGDPIWPAEADFNIDDFEPGVGSIAIDLANEIPSKFHVVTDAGDLWTEYATYGPGVYYVDGDIALGPSNKPSTDVTLTLVATGQVSFHLDTNFQGWYPQDADETFRLAIFAYGGGPTASCISKDLHVTSTNGIFTGIMFAPYGEAKFSTSSSTTQHGCVIGYQTSIDSSSASMVCDPGESNTQGSINMMQ